MNERIFTIGTPREQEVYRQLVQWIHKHHLQAGDQIPPQQELRSEFRVRHEILTRAMERLVDDGAIGRKRRAGTVVVDPGAVDMSAWMVALPLNWDWDATPSPFYARLICLMQQQLTMAGCQCRAYPHIARGVERAHQINDYLNLSKDVEAGLVNAVLTAGSLDPSDHRTLLQRGIPVCFCGSWDLASCGSVIDSDRFARDACHLLWDQGIRHVGLVASRKHSGNQSVFDGAHAAASTLAGLRLDELDRKIEGGTSHINHFVAIGRETADHLLSLPLDLRPQALIITDDHIAQGLAHVLSIESDYVPKLVVQTHRAAPMIFNLPVIRYEVDDAQLARTAVDMTIQRLLNPDLMDEVQWHIPQLVQSAVVHQ